MDVRTRVPVAAVMAALMLSASAAHGQTTAPVVPSSSEEPQVTVPSSSEAPQVSVPSSADERQAPVPTPKPGAEPKLAVPDSIWQDGDPDAPPPGAKPQPYLLPTRMVHKKRRGFVVAGAIVFGLLYSVQLIAALGVGASYEDQGCNSVCSNQQGLLLLPIAGPWLSDGADPHHGSLTPDLIYGGIEAAGLVMLIVGLVGHDVPAGPTPGRNLTFLPFVTPQAEGLSMAMRW